MSFDSDKSFDLDNGASLSEGGPSLFGITEDNSPVGNAAPLNSMVLSSKGQMWIKNGSGVNDWRIFKGGFNVVSSKPTYSGGVVSYIEYFSSTVQITANRLFKETINYSSGDVTSTVINIYDPDNGVTVLRTVTNTITYTLGDVTNLTEVES